MSKHCYADKNKGKIKNNMKIRMNGNKGITLIALVITIIVLLILAGVTIAALSGDNGILKRATEAKEQTNQKNDEETEKIGGYESTIDQYVDGNGGGSGSGGSGGGTGTNFTNVNTSDSNPAGAVPANSTVVEADANKGIVIKDKNNLIKEGRFCNAQNKEKHKRNHTNSISNNNHSVTNFSRSNNSSIKWR